MERSGPFALSLGPSEAQRSVADRALAAIWIRGPAAVTLGEVQE
jgi:hypothetical protein